MDELSRWYRHFYRCTLYLQVRLRPWEIHNSLKISMLRTVMKAMGKMLTRMTTPAPLRMTYAMAPHREPRWSHTALQPPPVTTTTVTRWCILLLLLPLPLLPATCVSPQKVPPCSSTTTHDPGLRSTNPPPPQWMIRVSTMRDGNNNNNNNNNLCSVCVCVCVCGKCGKERTTTTTTTQQHNKLETIHSFIHLFWSVYFSWHTHLRVYRKKKAPWAINKKKREERRVVVVYVCVCVCVCGERERERDMRTRWWWWWSWYKSNIVWCYKVCRHPFGGK